MENIGPMYVEQEKAKQAAGLNADLTPNADGNVTLDVNAPKV